MTGRAAVALALSAIALATSVRGQSSPQVPPSPTARTVTLRPTDHPPVLPDLGALWFVPPASGRGPNVARLAALAAAMQLVDDEQHEDALGLLLESASSDGVLGDYASYYAGLAYLGLDRGDDARRAFRALQERPGVGYLAEAAALAEGASAEALGDVGGAVEIYERLSMSLTLAPDEVLMRLGRAAEAAGDVERAADAFGSVYYALPLSPIAAEAGQEYLALPNLPTITADSQRYRLELVRAERLFSARRFTDAQQGFARLSRSASPDDRALIQLRLAECDFHLRRFRAARQALQPYTTGGALQAEALYFYALTQRALGERAAYLKAIRQVSEQFPTGLWAEDALDNLATHHILVDEDEAADAVFRDLYARFSTGRHAERAAWKVGWRAYRARRYLETIRFFEQAAADFPRSNYRPAWIYWSGRAHAALNNLPLARVRFELAVDDYRNSYYGRLALRQLGGRERPPRVITTGRTDIELPPRNVEVIRALIGARRFDDALNELRYAQRAWGDSSAIQATIAWARREQGREESDRERFNLWRASINTMRQAYPQFLASGGERLPGEILTTIFPLAYWDLIQKHSQEHRLDPYLVAALVAQESTFVPEIRSSAGAVGLMQLIPQTARIYAKRLGLPYSSALLRNPEANIRMGTTYLADKVEEFGGLHLALASYNAGERAVRRWIAERPGPLDPEEFIDDIPYPETQLYVKRILGTAEDYRSLYTEAVD